MIGSQGSTLWVTLKHLLLGRHAELSPAEAPAVLAALHSADIILPATDGRRIRLRRITTPTAEQALLLEQLGITLPEHLSFDREYSADPAVA